LVAKSQNGENLRKRLLWAMHRMGAQAKRCARILRESLVPPDEHAARIVGEQLELLRSGTRYAPYAAPLVAVLVVLRVQNPAYETALHYWLASIVLFCAGMELVVRRISRIQAHTPDAVARLAQRYFFLAFGLIVLWTGPTLWAWNFSAAPQLFYRLLIGFTLAAAATVCAPHAATATAIIAWLAAAIFLRTILQNDPSSPIMFILAFAFITLMANLARSIYSRTRRVLELEHMRQTLIADLRTAHRVSEEARLRAERASQAKSEFLANMSHELRTPLNAILGFSEIISSRALGNTPDKYAEYGGLVHESGEALLTLISNLLELAKIESGRKTLHEEPVDLGSLIENAVNAAQARAAEKNLSLRSTIAGPLPLLSADMHAIARILEEIVANAITFTPQGGDVEIGAGIQSGEGIALWVSDTGIGIAPEDQPLVFDRFGRHRHDVTRRNHGMGMGLAIVKGLADMHGATIALDSNPGQSTRITITFPPARTLHLQKTSAA
jgi:two-component system cell cycle sensor histidine kinase PleC